MKKRFVSLLMAAVLVLSLLPLSAPPALAAETASETTPEASGDSKPQAAPAASQEGASAPTEAAPVQAEDPSAPLEEEAADQTPTQDLPAPSDGDATEDAPAPLEAKTNEDEPAAFEISLDGGVTWTAYTADMSLSVAELAAATDVQIRPLAQAEPEPEAPAALDPVPYGEPLTLTAELPADGPETVDFYWESALLGTAEAADGVAVLTYDTKTGLLPLDEAQTVLALPGGSADPAQALASFSVTVTPRPVAVTGLTAQPRPYNGTNVVALTGGALSGLLPEDIGRVTLHLPSTGTLDGPNAGEDRPVFFDPVLLTGDLAPRYVLEAQPVVTVTIAQAPLTPALFGPVTKTFDGTADAPAGLSLLLSGAVTGETPTAHGQLAYNSPDLAEATAITASDIALAEDWAVNYVLTTETVSIAAAITPADPTPADEGSVEPEPDPTEPGPTDEEPVKSELTELERTEMATLVQTEADAPAESTGPDPEPTAEAEPPDTDTATQPETAPDAVYGDPLTLTAELPADGPKTVDFYCNSLLLGTIDAENGVAALIYDTKNGGIPVGPTQTIDLYPSGSREDPLATLSVTLAPLPLVITPDALSKTYGSPDPDLTYTWSGQLPGESPAFTGVLARTPGVNAGSYPLDLGTLALEDTDTCLAANYRLTLCDDPTPFTIHPAVLTPTLSGDGATLSADTDLSALSIVLTGGVNGQQPTAAAQFAATDQAITASNITLADPWTANYTLSTPILEVPFALSTETDTPIDEEPIPTETDTPIDGESIPAEPDTPADETPVSAEPDAQAPVCSDPAACPTQIFSDLAPEAWYHQAVDAMRSGGLMLGTGPTQFAPEAPLTRAMAATILYRQAGAPVVPDRSALPDVLPEQWYAPAAQWAAASGLLPPDSAGLFCPQDPLSRQDLADLLFRFAQFQSADTSARGDLTLFPDADSVRPDALPALQWAVAQGLLTGAGGSLHPTAPATRAETAVMLYRFLQL